MATDATGTPTSLGIPTLNVGTDAPTGNGENNMMAAIDALFVARTKAFTATGDLLYALSSGTPARLGIGSTGQVLTVVGGVPAWAGAATGTPALAASNPSNPTGTTSGSYKMMGLNLAFTPATSGRVLMTSFMVMSGGGSSNLISVQLKYGTGTAPSNGGTAAGTQVGGTLTAGDSGSGTVVGVVTGLTLSTAYWLDLAVFSTDGSHTAVVTNVALTAEES